MIDIELLRVGDRDLVIELREAGREVDAEVLARISPARSSAVNYYGSPDLTTRGTGHFAP
ncbi:hypothetical protein ACIRQP_31980 [Streptomyces sp. NPDC102274]|uniref:hypothetical protein n=1 Tax=Streptomyces sp. NPDC102274 TaxID=3366151 RepID=UPI00382637A2